MHECPVVVSVQPKFDAFRPPSEARPSEGAPLRSLRAKKIKAKITQEAHQKAEERAKTETAAESRLGKGNVDQPPGKAATDFRTKPDASKSGQSGLDQCPDSEDQTRLRQCEGALPFRKENAETN